MKTAIAFLLIIGLVPLFAFPAEQKEHKDKDGENRGPPDVCKMARHGRQRIKQFLMRLCDGRDEEEEKGCKAEKREMPGKKGRRFILRKIREHICDRLGGEDEDDSKEEEAEHNQIRALSALKCSKCNVKFIKPLAVRMCTLQLGRQTVFRCMVAHFLHKHKLHSRMCDKNDDDDDEDEDSKSMVDFVRKRVCNKDEDDEDDDEGDDDNQ